MASFWARVLVTFMALTAPLLCADNDPALATYKSGNYEAALPLLQSDAAKDPNDPVIQAALLSSLVNCDRIDDALAADKRDETAFPDSPEVAVARAEFAFYMGDMPQTEKLLKAANKLKETGRACFMLSKLYRSASFYRTGRLFCLRAHVLDPDDADITRLWLRYIPEEKRRELMGAFVEAHPWLYKHAKLGNENFAALQEAVEGKKVYETEGGPQEITMKFSPLMRDARRERGVGLDFRIGNGKPLRILFDTGASGITVKQSAVDKAGLEHVGSGVLWGVGDKGTRNTFSAVSDTCQVGNLRFKTCVFGALEGKGAIAGDEDGLLGADFFRDYVVQIDFQKHTLHLTPLPPRPADPQGYDRVVAPDESKFTPVFRFGHMLCASTKVNDKSTGLFLLDTGAEISNIDSTFARLTTKLHGDNFIKMHGVSGAVKNVYDADKANLQFGHFRQQNVGLVAFNMNAAPEHRDIRLSGVLGMDVLSLFRLTIDYRNGLVDFDYILENKKK